MKNANTILNAIIDEQYKNIPNENKSDFMRKMDCEIRKTALEFAKQMCELQKEECALSAELYTPKFTDDTDLDRESILYCTNVCDKAVI